MRGHTDNAIDDVDLAIGSISTQSANAKCPWKKGQRGCGTDGFVANVNWFGGGFVASMARLTGDGLGAELNELSRLGLGEVRATEGQSKVLATDARLADDVG